MTSIGANEYKSVFKKKSFWYRYTTQSTSLHFAFCRDELEAKQAQKEIIQRLCFIAASITFETASS
jgi:hypothetical protein